MDPEQVRLLRENRVSLRAIAKTTGVSTSVVRGVLDDRPGGRGVWDDGETVGRQVFVIPCGPKI